MLGPRSLPELCGQLLTVGFDGERLPPRVARALAGGQLGGIILFKRNVPTLEAACALASDAVDTAGTDLPPFIGIDEEGGRVRRLPSPCLPVPSMRHLAATGSPARTRRVAQALGRELAAIGFNVNFAPVLDVDTNPANPVIGDRSFSREPVEVAEHAIAYFEGLGPDVLACGKHFPGHGDTDIDSHLGLPRIAHDRARLEAGELVPFRRAIAAGLRALMSAHMVVECLDPERPATLSPAIATGLLRDELGFRGVLFSDDLEMKAVAARFSWEEASVEAVAAGCDELLVCHEAEAHARAHEGLVREAERSQAFKRRCEEAADRVLSLRRAVRARPLGAARVRDLLAEPEILALARELSADAPAR